MAGERTPMKKTKWGAVIFFVLLVFIAFGIVGLSSNIFLGRPMGDVVRDFVFMILHR
jgi:hypothetical protein